MSWQFLILGSVLLYSVSVLLQKILLKTDKSDPVSFAIFFQLLVGVLVGIFAVLFAGGLHFPNLKPLVLNLILMTVLYGFGNVFIFKSLKSMDASKFTIIFSSRALFTILASSLILSEGLTPKQWLGALAILGGVVLVTIKSKKFSLKGNEAVALLAAMAFGFANTNDRVLVKSIDVYPYVVIGFILPAILIGIFNPNSIKKMKVFLDRKILVKMIILCLFYGAAAIAFFIALRIAPNSSQVVTVNLTSVIVTVILSIVFLKERDAISRKILGAILSFVGLVLVG